MTEEEYEILPHKLLSDLKYDVEALKKKLTEPDAKSNELILEIESMKDLIHELNVIFEKALQETKDEDISKIVHTLNERLETVVNQNEIIARGMIVISDKLEEFMHGVSKPKVPVQHNMGLPPVQGKIAPKPVMNDLPPPPPKKKPRTGLFK